MFHATIASILFVGAYTPQSQLKDGVDSCISINPYTQESGEARKGTIAATLNNVALLNHLLKSETKTQEIEEIIEILDSLLVPLRNTGMFHLFDPIEWIGDGHQEGRVLLTALYLKKFPQEMNKEISNVLQKLTNLSLYTKEKIDQLNISP